MKKIFMLFVVAASICLLAGCSASGDQASDANTSDQAQVAEEQSGNQAQTAGGAADDVDKNDPRYQAGKTFEIPFADAAKLEALGLHQATFTENRRNTPEDTFDSLVIWARHDIPAGENRSEYDESGVCDYIDSEKGFFGNYAYYAQIPVGDDDVDLAYHFNYDSSYTNGDEATDTGVDDVVAYLEETDHEYQIVEGEDSTTVLAVQKDPMRDDGSVYLRSYRIFRITGDTTVVVAISTNHVLVGSAESAEAVQMFEALSDAFGMASPYTAG